MLFWYRVYSKETKSVLSGFCIAKDFHSAFFLLSKNFDVLFLFWSWSGGRFLRELKSAFQDLLVIVASGVKLTSAFCLASQSSHLVANTFTSISAALSRGEKLSLVVKEQFTPLDPVLSGILSVGNSTKDWQRSINNTIHYLDYRIKLSNCVKQALVYPMFVVGVMVGITWFHSFYLLPQVGSSCYSIPVLVTLVWLFLLSIFLFADKLYLGQDYLRSCYFQSLHFLMSSGLSVQDAIHISSEAFEREELQAIQSQVLQGFELSSSLSAFPPLVKSMIGNAERHGGLDQACKNVADFYMERMEKRLNLFISLFGPCVVCLVGILLVLVAASGVNFQYDILAGMELLR